MQLDSKFIQVNGIQLHYVEQGKGPLVILLHGFPEFWYGWRKQIPVLAEHYRVVAPDLRGFNLSDKPSQVSDYDITILAKDIQDLILALNETNAIIVGHDWGGVIAWAVASLHPQVVNKLVIINAPHLTEMSKFMNEFNLSQLRKSWYIFLFQIPFLAEKIVGTESFFKKAIDTFSKSSPEESKKDMKMYIEAYAQPGAVKSTLAYYRQVFKTIFPSLKIDFPKVKCAVLTIWGEKDVALGKELTYNNQAYCELPCEIMYVPHCGHFVHQEDAELVNKKLLSFLAG